MMRAIEYVKQGDRSMIVMQQANELVEGTMSIGESIDLLEDLVEAKSYFEDFFGVESKEFELSKTLISIIRMIARSIRNQNESPEQKLRSWVSAMPIRVCCLANLEKLILVK